MIKLSPSILSANFMNLKDEIDLLEKENVPYVHVDVMDGVFVPNISIGMPVINSLRKSTNLILDVHLMIIEPERYIDDFINIGCDIINFHLEATSKPLEIIEKIKKNNKKVGITIKPNTNYKEVIPYLDKIDLILVMTVEPGFGGQKLIENCLYKIEKISKYIKDNNLNCELEVDGGVKLDNVEKVIQAGANVIVVGSDIFSSQDKSSVIQKYNEIFLNYKL